MTSAGGDPPTQGTKRKIGEVYADQVGVTELDNQDTFSFLWLIKNFSDMGNSAISSPVFSGGVNGHGWKLEVVKGHFGSAKEEYLGVHLTLLYFGVSDSWDVELDRLLGFGASKLKTRIELTLFDEDENVIHQVGVNQRIIAELSPRELYGWPKFIPTSQLNPTRCPSDTVRIHCKLIYSEGTHGRILEANESLN